MDRQPDQRIFWIVVFGLLLLTRIPAMASYFSIDNVSLALSLEKFDPRVHQPQPPGYPFFVLTARIVHFFLRDAQRTFTVISIIVSALSLIAAYALGKRMFSRWAGAAAVLLLLVNPPFWQSTLNGPLRPYLALFSLLTAYCCWRCWNGEQQFAIWGAVALGIGSGFRPDLLAFLFPVWFVSSWVGTKSWRKLLQGIGVLAAIVFVWVAALVIAMGGPRAFFTVMLNYGVEQSKPESIVFGSSVMAWLRQVNRVVIWNGLSVITWIWVLPFAVWASDALKGARRAFVFGFVWLIPGLIVQALIHIDEPGHTLFSVAALCVFGGYFLSIFTFRDVLLAAALILNVMLFMEFFPLPANVTNTANSAPSMKNALLFGTFESSIENVRWLDDVTRTTLREIQEFTPKDRPVLVLTTDSYVSQWFMNWRIGRYYLPAVDFWVLSNDQKNKRVEHIRRNVSMEMRESPPFRVPIFREGRILWLIEPDSAFHKELASVAPLKGGKYIFYSDITPDTPAFSVDGFEIGLRSDHDGFQ